MTASDQAREARWMALGAAALFSTGGAAIKATSLDGLQVAGLRSLIAAATLWVVLPAARDIWDRRIGAVALAYAGCLALFAASNKLTTAVHAILLQSTSPLYIALLGPWLLGERTRSRDWIALAVIALGMGLMVSSGEQATVIATNPTLGNTLAIGSGVCWAATVMGLRWLSQGRAGMAGAAALAGNLVAAAICLPLAGFAGYAQVGAVDVLALGWLGVFQIGAAYFLLTRAMPHLGAMDAALLLYLEPVMSGVWAWAVHGEVPGVPGLVGSAVILVGLGLHAWLSRRTEAS